MADKIGWKSNGFQIEVGYVSLGIALACLLTGRLRGFYWLPIIIISSVSYLGAALNHILEMTQKQNFNPYNVFIIIPDILTPLTLIILWLIYSPALRHTGSAQ